MRIGAYQFAVSSDIENNYHRIQNGIQEAVKNGVKLLVFPECALTGYPPRDIENSTVVDFAQLNCIYKQLQDNADKHSLYIVVGSIENIGDSYYNSALLFAPHRKRRTYQKRALWGWDKDNSPLDISKVCLISMDGK